jgi:hypothetical protein
VSRLNRLKPIKKQWSSANAAEGFHLSLKAGAAPSCAFRVPLIESAAGVMKATKAVPSCARVDCYNNCRRISRSPLLRYRAIVAPRLPIGCGLPVVVSVKVWCSISALISAPISTTTLDSHIQIINPITAPSEP